MKHDMGDMNLLLSNLLEAHDPILTNTIRRDLADKLHPALALLNRLEGVSEDPVPPKQWGKDKATKMGEAPKIKNELKGNVALGSKGKDPMVDVDEEEENKKSAKAKGVTMR